MVVEDYQEAVMLPLMEVQVAAEEVQAQHLAELTKVTEQQDKEMMAAKV